MSFPNTDFSNYPDEPGIPGVNYGQQSAPSVFTSGGTDVDPWAGYEDYYGFDERARWYFPDGKQWIEFRKLTEGDRAKYLKATRSDVHLNQQTKEARIAFDQSQDRKQLLLHSLVDWHVVQIKRNPDGTRTVTPLPFPAEGGGKHSPGGVLSQWIDRQNPELLASLEKKIRKINPWLMSEMSSEQIRKEIADLQELLATTEEREGRESTFPATG